MAKLAIYQLTLSSDPTGQLRGEKMELQSAEVKREIEWAELDEWRKKAYHSSKLYKGADEKMT